LSMNFLSNQHSFCFLTS